MSEAHHIGNGFYVKRGNENDVFLTVDKDGVKAKVSVNLNGFCNAVASCSKQGNVGKLAAEIEALLNRV